MSHLTKAELVSRLTTDEDAKAKMMELHKQDLVELYRQMKENPMLFSDDDQSQDEAAANVNLSSDVEVSFPAAGKKTSRQSSTKNSSTESLASSSEHSGPGTRKSVSKKASTSSRASKGGLTEDNSLLASGINVADLADDELYEKLREFNIDVGPIVDSTRQLYQKKLAILLRGDNDNASFSASAENSAANGGDNVDGQNGTSHRNGVNGFEQCSADEEDQQDGEEIQPEPVVKRASSNARRSMSKGSTASKLSERAVAMRQRFNALGSGKDRADRFTPTPRRSIHSYKVTETSKETLTKSPDGNISRDYVYTKETSDDQSLANRAAGRFKVVLRWAPKVMIAVLFVAVIFYSYKQSRLLTPKK